MSNLGSVARAVEHELERDLLDDYLNDLDVEFGPVPDTIERVRRAMAVLVLDSRH